MTTLRELSIGGGELPSYLEAKYFLVRTAVSDTSFAPMDPS